MSPRTKIKAAKRIKQEVLKGTSANFILCLVGQLSFSLKFHLVVGVEELIVNALLMKNIRFKQLVRDS
jgi:hypothetical protein